jgi:hypothetical protein
MAQGVQVFAADYSNDGGGYDDGTSVAAPIVAAVWRWPWKLTLIGVWTSFSRL